jgi:hypothetical protein
MSQHYFTRRPALALLLFIAQLSFASTPVPAIQIKTFPMAAVLESGPDDSPALRIQLATTAAGNTVWTVLYGEAWRRVLNGERQVKSSIRTCTDWGSSRSACSIKDGFVVFTAPVSGKAGQTVQGSLRYLASKPAQDVVLPFTATVQRGLMMGAE